MRGMAVTAGDYSGRLIHDCIALRENDEDSPRGSCIAPARFRSIALAAFVFSSLAAQPVLARQPYDILVKGGTIYDGSGQKPFRGDVGIRDGRIVHVGRRTQGRALRTIDARGKAVAPGFINAMSQTALSLLTSPLAESDLRQGVTLVVVGEGTSAGPLTLGMLEELHRSGGVPADLQWRTLDQFAKLLKSRGIAVNVASWVGGSTLRQNVVGLADRVPSADELARMRALVREAMEDGALGVSTALIYAPGAYAKTDELVALAEQSAQCGGLFASHIRSEGDRFLEALDELIAISRRSGAPAELFHIKVGGPANWPAMPIALNRIQAARAAGIRISANMYSYAASGTGLTASIPPWVQQGGWDAFMARIKDPAIRARGIAEMRDPKPDWENVMRGAGGPDGVVLSSFRTDALRRLAGKTLAEIAKLRGTDPEETLLQLIEEDGSRIEAFYFTMSEDNLRLQLRQPYVSIGSDAAALSITPQIIKSGAHPRAFGTFARIYAKYVREEKVLTMQEAVRRMTSLPAAHYQLGDRGWLKPGFTADVVVFDPARIRDRATYQQPFRFAEGVEEVLVNGVPTVVGGEPTGALAGRFVRGRAWTGRKDGGCRAAANDWPWPLA